MLPHFLVSRLLAASVCRVGKGSMAGISVSADVTEASMPQVWQVVQAQRPPHPTSSLGVRQISTVSVHFLSLPSKTEVHIENSSAQQASTLLNLKLHNLKQFSFIFTVSHNARIILVDVCFHKCIQFTFCLRP